MNDEMEFEGGIWRLGDGWIFVNEQPTATAFEQRNAVLLQGEVCIFPVECLRGGGSGTVLRPARVFCISG